MGFRSFLSSIKRAIFQHARKIPSLTQVVKQLVHRSINASDVPLITQPITSSEPGALPTLILAIASSPITANAFFHGTGKEHTRVPPLHETRPSPHPPPLRIYQSQSSHTQPVQNDPIRQESLSRDPTTSLSWTF